MLICSLLFVFAASFVVLPTWLRNKTSAFESEELRKNTNITLFNERSDELESEFAAGNLEQPQFEALLQELQRSLLADVEKGDAQVSQEGKDKSNTRKQKDVVVSGLSPAWLPLGMVLLLPLIAYSLYSEFGYIKDVELMGLFQRTVTNIDDLEEVQALIVSLGEAVQEDEDQPWAWYFLGENFANLRMFTEAEIAYEQSASRLEDSPDKAAVLGRLAQAMYINAETNFTPEILAVVEQARAINPSELSILQLLAADAENRQDYQSAIEYWRLLIQANPNSEQANLLRRSISAAQTLLQESGIEVATGPVVEVNLSLAEGIEVEPNLRVFVAIRNAAREGMPPLAAIDLRAGDLPTTIRLDNNSAVGPFNLASADTVYVSALVSYAGVASPATGDYRVLSERFAHNGQHALIDLVITERVP